MFCRNCGAEVQGNYKFCMKCGAAIDWNQSQNPTNQIVNNDLIQNASQVATHPQKKKIDKSKIIGLSALGVVLIAFLVVLLNVLNPNVASFRPSGMSDDTFRLGNEAYEIIRDYNNGKISKDTAIERVDRIYNNLKSLDKTLPKEAQSYNLYVQIELSAFTWDARSGGDTLKNEKQLRKTLGYAQ